MLIFKLALRNIMRNRRRSLLTLLSMSGGFFLLSLTLSMSEGSYNNIIDIFTQEHTGHVQVHSQDYLTRPSLYKTINNSEEVIRDLESSNQVIGVAPRIYGPSLAYGKNKTFPAQTIGIDPERESKTTRLKDKITQGQYLTNTLTTSQMHPAMIGFSLAKNLNLSLGDELVLISQGADGSIANDVFEITAILGNSTSYESGNVYLTLVAIREFLTLGDKVHELAITLPHQEQARYFSIQLQEKLKEQELSVAPWQVVESSFYKGMQADKKGSYVSMGIIIFIVSIGVLNTILMGTMERTQEFGVLKAIGTKPMSVFGLIMLESFFLAIVSCIAGLVLSLPVTYWLAQTGIPLPEAINMGGILFDSMRGEMSLYVYLLPTLVVTLSTLIVSLFPSIRAAHISPLKALQAS